MFQKIESVEEYTVTRPYAGFRHPDRIFLFSHAHVGILYSSMRKTFPEFSTL
jgi:hypothetical protein